MLAMLNNLYQELAMVGLISLAFFVITTSVALDKHTKYLFEVVHLSLVFLTLFYILLVCCHLSSVCMHWLVVDALS
jgi:hypothetical protein